MNKNTIAIICNKNILNFKKNCNFNIGVDSGALAIIKQNLRLDLAIGDFDSVDLLEFNLIKKVAKKIIKFKKEKDYLDGYLGIKAALKYDLNSIIYYYVDSYNRLDFNFATLNFIYKYNLLYFDKKNFMKKLNLNSNIFLYNDYKKYQYFSIIPITNTKISIKNAKYNTLNLILEPLSQNGLSNEMIFNKDLKINISYGECVICFLL